MDPLTVQRLGHIRHQEISAEAHEDDFQPRRWFWTLASLLGLVWRQVRNLVLAERRQTQPVTISDRKQHI
jgi:hypothetical protein